MSKAGDEDFLVSFRALAIMLKRAAAEGAAMTEALENLEPREKGALRNFQLAAEQCLGQLKGWTLLALESIGLEAVDSPHSSVKHRKTVRQTVARKTQLCLDLGDAEKTVKDNFKKFDSDSDGVLDEGEFSKAMLQLTNGTIDEGGANKMLAEADLNKDGKIDINEFLVWLYGRKEGETDGENGENAAEQLEELQERVDELELELTTKTRALNRLESEHEREMDATHDFWKSVAQHAVANIEKKVDLESAQWLGNGKYGFVLKAARKTDDRELVVKMMGIRWAHLAAKEWLSGSMCGRHENIVEYEEVMLHADDDKSIQKLLQTGYETGALKSKAKKRSTFPDRFICLTQEFMNRGTVQDWIDNDVLLPGGEFVVMQKVATALSFMHKRGVTHNDIKPENIMLHQSKPEQMSVKLGDLGLATTSKEVADMKNDFWQYGMTAFCMIIGEKFGTRKYRRENVSEICDELSTVVEDSGSEGKLLSTYKGMPELLAKVFPAEISFQEVRQWPGLQDWDFFEGGDSEDKAPETNPIAHARHRKTMGGQMISKALEDLTAAHACETMS